MENRLPDLLRDREAAFVRQLNSSLGAFHSPTLHAYPTIAGGWAFRIHSPRDKGISTIRYLSRAHRGSLPLFISLRRKTACISPIQAPPGEHRPSIGSENHHREQSRKPEQQSIYFFYLFFFFPFYFVLFLGVVGFSGLTCQWMEFVPRTLDRGPMHK